MLAASFAHALLHAQLKAVQALANLLETTTDPKELRRIATVLLKARLPIPPAEHSAEAVAPAPSAPITRPEPVQTPLTPAEISALTARLPEIPPTAFTSQNTPSYWRCVLGTHDEPRPSRSAPRPDTRAGPGRRAA